MPIGLTPEQMEFIRNIERVVDAGLFAGGGTFHGPGPVFQFVDSAKSDEIRNGFVGPIPRIYGYVPQPGILYVNLDPSEWRRE